ncbi:cytochrome P450 4V2 [Trichonephila clavata]|uniref:Cytochrome P450 4V2 n=1 Tax=Trichonephila clavata TaxID=2740835 RepID=A0A8X6F206_TRICU|nr:cytochrome P450 4V2 [Trichonephila clavata]
MHSTSSKYRKPKGRPSKRRAACIRNLEKGKSACSSSSDSKCDEISTGAVPSTSDGAFILSIAVFFFDAVSQYIVESVYIGQKFFQCIPGNKIGFFNVLGDLKEIIKLDLINPKYDIHKYVMTIFRRWVEHHKEEQLFCLWFLYKPIVVFIRADAVKELLKHPKMYEKSPFYETAEYLFGKGIITSPVEKWKPRRKSLNPCFHHDMLKIYLEVFNAYSQQLVNILKQETEKEFCDIRKPLTGVALDIVCETMLGFPVGAAKDTESQYIKALEKLSDIGIEKLFKVWLWPYVIFRFTGYYREGYPCVQLFQDLARSGFNRRKKEYLNKNTTDGSVKPKVLIDVMLKLHFESQELSEEEAVTEIITFIIAGYETVSLSATWALFLIGHHPDVQAKIHEELDKVFAENNDIYATEEDLNQLVYLNSVLMESSRIYTTIPIFGRQAKEDIVICGHTIPKGASCFVAAYFLHKDEKVFPDPEKFDPDRFSPENSAKIPEGAFVPFSAGPRNCIGKFYAWMELKTIMSYILRNYTVESLDSEDKIVPEMKIELAPSTPIRLRIRPRKSSTL